MKAERLPSGKYRARATYYDTCGKQHAKSFTADTEKKAISAALNFLETYKYYNAPENITVEQAMLSYIQLKENVLAPATLAGYRVTIRNSFPNLKHRKVTTLTHLDIQQAVNDEIKIGHSAKTIKNAYSFLTASLRQICNIEFHQPITLPRQQKNKRIVSENIIPSIYNAVKDTRCELAVLLALTMGLRMSEIMGLKWEDYDGYIIYVHRTRTYVEKAVHEKELTKTEAGNRYITVPQTVKRILDNTERKSDLIIPITNRQVYITYKKCLKEHNLPDMSFHFLRHLNATVMMKLGISEKYAMQRGGWSTPSVYKTIYAHIITDEMKKTDDVINDTFDRYFV